MSRKLNRTLAQNPSSSQFQDKQSSVFSVQKAKKDTKPIIATQDWIVRLKQQNRRLKDMRDNLISKKRAITLMEKNSNDRDENYWKRELDKLKFLAKSKRLIITALNEKIKKVEEKGEVDEDNPIARSIRILENKLDKTMIKYNEAVGMKQTYEHLTNRLKEERINYENQLNIIQSTLKGKEHDFQELTLLAHDAGHAKQMAQHQLKEFENKKLHVRNLRQKFMNEKKDDIVKNRLNVPTERMQTSSKIEIQRSVQYKNEKIESDPEQELAFYEEALKKLVEVSGGTNTEQIIEKFRTQSQTNKSMQQLEESYKIKLEYLRAEISQKREILKSNLVVGTNKDQKKMADQMDINADKILNDCEKMKTKFQKTNKLIVNATAGVEHLLQNFNQTTQDLSKLDFQELLSKAFQKLMERHQEITQHPNFKPKMLQESKSIGGKEETKKPTGFRKSEVMKDKDSDIEYEEARQTSQRESKVKISNDKVTKSNILTVGSSGRVRKSLKKS